MWNIKQAWCTFKFKHSRKQSMTITGHFSCKSLYQLYRLKVTGENWCLAMEPRRCHAEYWLVGDK